MHLIFSIANLKVTAAANKFFLWCECNKLTININKSKSMVFLNKIPRLHNSLREGVDIRVKGIKLELVSKYKYLGILLDENLSFTNHVSYLLGIISQRIYLLKTIRHYVDVKTALLLYKTMILNYFDIGDIFYDCCKKSQLKKLQTCQNTALRCIYGNRSDLTTVSMHKEAGLLFLDDGRRIGLISQVHKYNIGKFIYEHKNLNSLRSSSRIILTAHRVNCRCYENSFVHKGITLWNSLPEYFKRMPANENKLFKTHVRKELQQNKLTFPE